MRYRPRWERIFLLGIMLNAVIIFVGVSTFPKQAKVEEPEELIEVAWVDSEVEAVATPTTSEVPAFPEINLPPIEIPKIEIPELPELVVNPIEPLKEVAPPAEEKSAEPQPAEPEPKPAETHDSKLKVIAKVYPKDLIAELVASGAIKERVTISNDKIVLAVTIDTNGRVKNVEIRRGGGNDERGNIINLVCKAAAGGWIFEPYLDKDGNPKELKTQIEFKPEDF